MFPEKMRYAVVPKGMQAGIAKENFQDTPGCRVLPENGTDIFTYMFAHNVFLFTPESIRYSNHSWEDGTSKLTLNITTPSPLMGEGWDEGETPHLFSSPTLGRGDYS
jgi:hypothetical protein